MVMLIPYLVKNPVSTRRRLDFYTTSITLKRRHMDVNRCIVDSQFSQSLCLQYSWNNFALTKLDNIFFHFFFFFQNLKK